MKLFISLLFILSNFIFASSIIEFTDAEKQYLKSKPTVSLGSLNNYVPFTFIKNENLVGFTHDIIKIISEKTGIKFKKVSGTWPQIYSKFSTGK